MIRHFEADYGCVQTTNLKYIKTGNKVGGGQHANHPSYSKQILKYLNEWADEQRKRGSYTPQAAKAEFERVANMLKSQLQTECVQNGKKVNDLILKFK